MAIHNPELEELARVVHPEKVLDRMDQVEQETVEDTVGQERDKQ